MLTLTLPGKRLPGLLYHAVHVVTVWQPHQPPQYGIVAFWGMTEAQEQELLAGVLVARGAAAQVVEEDDRQVG